MKIVKPTVTLSHYPEKDYVYRFLEKCGRTCYKSEPNENLSSAEFIKRLIKSGHESVLEHYSLTFIITCDRGVSHELVRHRLASYSQESTRYCTYNGEMEFIKPIEIKEDTVPFLLWKNGCEFAETTYHKLLKSGVSAQNARSVLPNSLKTEIVMTANLREWRHFLNLRYFGRTGKPHPDMKEIAGMIYKIIKNLLPEIVEDLDKKENSDAFYVPNIESYIEAFGVKFYEWLMEDSDAEDNSLHK